MKRKVKWGILSTAKIGTQKVVPAMQRGDLCEIYALASRSESSASTVAAELGIPKAFGSYEALLADPEVEAIYNPLPNHLHVTWTIKALEAGKHVLCEKPIALSAAEAEQLIIVADKYPHLKVMEAFMYRFHPQWIQAKDLVSNGEIGALLTIQSFFSYHNTDPGNIRNKAELGGGGLMDIGCYCISLSRFLYDDEPLRVAGTRIMHPEFKTDTLTSGMMEFQRGTSSFTCSTQLEPYQRVNIFGDKGRIEIEIPFNAPPDKRTKMWLVKGGKQTLFEFDPCDQYTRQGDLFSQAIINNSHVPTPLSDAVSNMKVIEAIVRSSEANSWITC